jgi:hypothetical protein
MVSVKRLLIATCLLLGEVAATPFAAGKLSIAAAEVRTINDFAIESRDLNDVSVVDIGVPSKNKRALIPPKAPATKPTPPKTPASKNEPPTPPIRLGSLEPATQGKCRRSKTRSLQRRGPLSRASDPNDIRENQFALTNHLGPGGTATVTYLSGCTALFFYDATDTPSVFHIMCGEEKTKSAEAASLINDLGKDTNGVAIVAGKEENYMNAAQGIREASPETKIHLPQYYDVKPTQEKNTRTRVKITATAGSKSLVPVFYEACSLEPQRF